MIFVNLHCVDIFGISTRDWEKFFVRLASGWSDYEGAHLLVALTRIVFAYHSTMELCAERCRLLFPTAVAEQCIFALRWLVMYALAGGRVE